MLDFMACLDLYRNIKLDYYFFLFKFCENFGFKLNTKSFLLCFLRNKYIFKYLLISFKDVKNNIYSRCFEVIKINWQQYFW